MTEQQTNQPADVEEPLPQQGGSYTRHPETRELALAEGPNTAAPGAPDSTASETVFNTGENT